jgi:hypothetical protein
LHTATSIKLKGFNCFGCLIMSRDHDVIVVSVGSFRFSGLSVLVSLQIWLDHLIASLLVFLYCVCCIFDKYIISGSGFSLDIARYVIFSVCYGNMSKLGSVCTQWIPVRFGSFYSVCIFLRRL